MSEIDRNRRIKSYVRREGRITLAQQSALTQLWARYGIEWESEPIDFDLVFARQASRVMEIGFGMGHSLIKMAQSQPDVDFIGVEVYRPGVGALLKAAEQIRDVAAELLALHSKRLSTPGFAFKKNSAEFNTFRSDFPFEETIDQTNAIDAVIKDMCSPHSMDRLVCGDVGFGKTEVALQASYVATHNNKQVAVLVPTTLLANQHFNIFVDKNQS